MILGNWMRERDEARRGTAMWGMARSDMARWGTAWYGPVRHGMDSHWIGSFPVRWFVEELFKKLLIQPYTR